MANVSSCGPSSRSGRSSSAPSASLPMYAASTITKERPRTCSGISGMGGNCMRRPAEVISSGVSAAHSLQAFSTSAARSKGKKRMPA